MACGVDPPKHGYIKEYMATFHPSVHTQILVGGYNHLEKWWSSSMGRMTSHIWNGKIKAMFETTNQLYIGVTYSISLTWNKAGIATPNANHHSGEVAERSRWNLPVYTCNKCIFSHVSHIVDTQFFVESTRWCPQVMLVGVHPPILSEIGVTDLAVVWLRTRFPNSFIAIMPNMEVS